MKKFTLILAASVLVAFAATNTARADHGSHGHGHGHSQGHGHGHSYGHGYGHGHHGYHSSHGGIYIQRGFGGYIGPHNVYRGNYSPYGIYGSPNYGCGPYYNPNGRVNGGFGIYFGF